MRCLRSITDAQQTGCVYLSEENKEILNDELQQNFRVTVEDISGIGKSSAPYHVHVKEPVEKVKLRRVRRAYHLQPKAFKAGASLGLAEVDTNRYRLIHTKYDGLPLDLQNRQHVETEDLTYLRDQRHFSAMTLVAEIARYLNLPCLEIEAVLANTREGIATILGHVNQFNELLYDVIILHLFKELYEVTEQEQAEDYEVELVKVPPEGYYQVSAAQDMVVQEGDVRPPQNAAKSFHLVPYCFDSKPERNLFWDLLRDRRVQKIYFTGMLTHGQSEFYIQYIDPESHTVRSYYPDFLVQKMDGSYLIVEVKRDDQIDEPVVQAKKEFAQQMAAASGMTYEMIKGSDANEGRYAFLFEGRAGTTSQMQLEA